MNNPITLGFHQIDIATANTAKMDGWDESTKVYSETAKKVALSLTRSSGEASWRDR